MVSLPDMGPREPENHNRLVIAGDIQARWYKPLLNGPAQRFQRAGFQVMKKHVTRHEVVAHREPDRPAVK